MANILSGLVFQLEDKVTGEILGYGFETDPTTAERAAGAADRLQRWLLFRRSLHHSFPSRETLVKPAVDTTWASKTSAASFRSQASSVFLSGRDLYVVVNCKKIQSDPIVAPGSHLPSVQFFPRMPDVPVFQGDYGLSKMFTDAAVGHVGYVNVVEDSSSTTFEFWALLDTYAVPSATVPVKLTGADFTEGEAFANVIDGTRWTSTCTFVIAACAYFTFVPTDG